MNYHEYLPQIDHLADYPADMAVTVDTILETLNHIKENSPEGGKTNIMVSVDVDCRYIQCIGYGTDVYGHITAIIFDRSEKKE